jgi:hypothetical protein
MSLLNPELVSVDCSGVDGLLSAELNRVTDVEILSRSLAGYYSSHGKSRSGGVKLKSASKGVHTGDMGKL